MMDEFGIKPDLKEEYIAMMGKNCLDGYSFGVVQAAVSVMGALDQGKTPAEANDAMKGMGISGFMAGCVAEIVSKYHIRGDEFRLFWNEYWGVGEDKANGGVVNPAIVTIG